MRIMQSYEERRLQNAVECLFKEGEMYLAEGERLEKKGELALSLAFYTNAASKYKQVTLTPNITSDTMLRAQIKRESCLKRARTMYRRLLVQSAQKTSNTHPPRVNKKSNQVNAEKRACNTCNKLCFWLKDGLCSECDLKATEVHRRNVRRNPHHNTNRNTNAVRDFTRPRSDYHRNSRQLYSGSAYSAYSESSSEEEYVPVKSCAICHAYRSRCC